MDDNIHYSLDASWVIGGTMGKQIRLTDKQKRTIMEAVWKAVWSVEHPNQEAGGSAMGDLTLRETIGDEDGNLKTLHTVFRCRGRDGNCEEPTIHTF